MMLCSSPSGCSRRPIALLSMGAAIACFALSPAASAAEFGAIFTAIGDLPGGAPESALNAVSGDGRVAVGVGNLVGGTEGVKFEDGNHVLDELECGTNGA